MQSEIKRLDIQIKARNFMLWRIEHDHEKLLKLMEQQEPKAMNGKKVLMPEHYAWIPELIADGWNKHQIAAYFGCTPQTLQVQCCRRGITLRTLDMKHEPMTYEKALYFSKAQHVKLHLGPDVLMVYDKKARAKGMDMRILMQQLLKAIITGKLVDEVLGVPVLEAAE
jgi:hypothetical protein